MFCMFDIKAKNLKSKKHFVWKKKHTIMLNANKEDIQKQN